MVGNVSGAPQYLWVRQLQSIANFAHFDPWKCCIALARRQARLWIGAIRDTFWDNRDAFSGPTLAGRNTENADVGWISSEKSNWIASVSFRATLSTEESGQYRTPRLLP
jgi:hypothetical protein